MTVKPNSRIYRQVRILDPVCAVDNVTDVLVIDGKIEQVGNNLGYDAESVEVMEGDSLILGPGLVDIYSISGEPGYEERETLESLAGAMEAGGFSRTAILPNTSPVMDNPATCAFFGGKGEGFIFSVLPVGSVNQWLERGGDCGVGFFGGGWGSGFYG